jgi:hypothetical protein
MSWGIPTTALMRRTLSQRPEYKIGHDPVCYRDPKQPHIQPESKRDPWLYVLPCRYGTIYPHGQDTLADRGPWASTSSFSTSSSRGEPPFSIAIRSR